MSFAILDAECRNILERIVSDRERRILFLRKRLAYGGKKGRSAMRHIRRMGGNWLYAPVDDIMAELTGTPT